MTAPLSKQTVEIVVKVYGILGSYEKAAAWLTTSNLNLGGASPTQLINSGRAKRVLEFVDAALPHQREL